MSVRNISPFSCSAALLATSTWKAWVPLLLATVSAIVLAAVALASAAGAAYQLYPAQPAAPTPAASASNPTANFMKSILFDHDRQRAFAALNDPCPQALLGFYLMQTGSAQRFHMHEYIG